MSVRTRLGLLHALLVLALCLVGALVSDSMERALLAEVDDALAARAASVAGDVRVAFRPGRGGVAEAIRLDPALADELAMPGVYVQILALDGSVLRASSDLVAGLLPAGGAIAPARTWQRTITAPGGERLRVLDVPVQENGTSLAVVRVASSLHQADVALRDLQRLLIIGGGLGLLALVLATWALVGQFLVPLERVVNTAERVAATGDVNVRVPTPDGGEIGRLSRSFNRMIERLRSLLASQQQLLADTSHELRNPLTVIRTNLGLLRRDLDAETRFEVVDETEAEADRMSRLVADLLLLAREDGGEAVEHERLDLGVVVEQAAARARTLAGGREIRCERPTEPVLILGDRDRLLQMLTNLLDNGIRHTAERDEIALGLAQQAGEAVLTVRDTGEGIPAEHLPRIFDRFYRVDKARSRELGGTGLGLAIVKHIAEAHGGSVSVTSALGQGATFTVRLPLEERSGGVVN
ncbi:MAG: ATP-binding protein [Chloroflexota bacterium]